MLLAQHKRAEVRLEHSYCVPQPPEGRTIQEDSRGSDLTSNLTKKEYNMMRKLQTMPLSTRYTHHTYIRAQCETWAGITSVACP